MEAKAVSSIMLTLLIISMLTLAFSIQPAKASGTIYIRADGSVEGTTHISSVDNVTYTFTGNIYDEIVVQKSDIVIDGGGYNLQGFGDGYGFFLSGINNVTIQNTYIMNFVYGLWLNSSSSITVLRDNITDNGDGIILDKSSNNIISGNNITNYFSGILLYESSNNTIYGNNITKNWDGICVHDYSSFNNISENRITNNYDGIMLGYYSNHNYISGNNITANDWDGIALIESSNNIISENDIIENNNDYGIVVGSYSNSNLIYRNNIRENLGGILLCGSSNNISGNNLINNTQWGFHVFSSDNIISGNNITNTSGTGISLYGSSNNTVSGNNITNSGSNGIYLEYSSNYNVIVGNNIANNFNSIGLGPYSVYNSVAENNITNNSNNGIWLYDSSNNKIYHNNFIHNTNQVVLYGTSISTWDNGYPSGGNYWSDYEERYPLVVDEYQGENQDIIGSDGIWDSPYVVDENNQDRYPFVNPWTPTPTVVTATLDIDPDTLNLRSGGKWITAYIQLPEEYNAEDIDATTILLNGTISPVLDPMYEFVANSSEYLVDHNEDGILERMVKFDNAEVMALLSVGEATLTITGEVNGTPFEGSDSIRVISPSTGSGGCKGFKK